MLKKQKIKDNPNGSARLSGQRYGALCEGSMKPELAKGHLFKKVPSLTIKKRKTNHLKQKVALSCNLLLICFFFCL